MSIGTDIEKLEQILSEALMNEFEAQGHSMTGKLIKDIEFVTKQEVNKLTISGYMYPYANYLAAGTKAANIPFSGRTGRGRTSLLRRRGQRRHSLPNHRIPPMREGLPPPCPPHI